MAAMYNPAALLKRLYPQIADIETLDSGGFVQSMIVFMKTGQQVHLKFDQGILRANRGNVLPQFQEILARELGIESPLSTERPYEGVDINQLLNMQRQIMDEVELRLHGF